MVLFGSVASLDLVWNLADVFMGLMAITNLFSITLLSKYSFICLKDYIDQKRAGIKEPIFNPEIISNQQGITVWQKNIDN